MADKAGMVEPFMRILDRYTLKTFFLPWVCVTLGFSFLFIVIDLMNQLGDFLDGGAGFLDVAGYYGRFLTSVWIYLSPVTLLLGLLFAMYQLTRNNEIIAMRASGISIYRVLSPFLLLGMGMSAATVWISASVAPRNLMWMDRFVQELRRPDASVLTNVRFRDPERNRTWDIREFDVENQTMTGVRVWQMRGDTGVIRHITSAERAEWRGMFWVFYGVEHQPHSEQGYPLGRPELDESRPMMELTESPRRIERETLRFEYMTSREMRRFLDTRPVSARTLADLRTQLSIRQAHAWLSLVTVMLAVPFSAQTARKGVFTGIVLCMLLFFSLIFTMNLFKALGQGGQIPPWLAGWFPTLVFGAIGLWFLRKLR